ncbi:MAG: ComEA family DNA-binding protein [Planctomycetota bacterium]|jgi:hypothetical protein
MLQATSGSNASISSTPDERFAVLACVAVVLVLSHVLWITCTSWRHAPSGAVPAITTTVNPNTAPWPELATLPRIGRKMARRIVAHRARVMRASAPVVEPRQVMVFQSPLDLARVKGIGPMTVRRLERYMDFAGGG